MLIDTTKVPVGPGGRRPLHFGTLDDLLADARACVAAERRPAGLLRRGNWTIGQALNHIAAWIEYPFTGYPAELVIPDDVKAQARAAKDRIMRAPMHPGDRLPLDGPAAAAGTLATEVVPADAGLARLESAARLLQSNAPSAPTPLPDPAFGVVTHDDWTQMTLRHAELHLSFFVP